MNFCRFIYNVFCGTNTTQLRINELRENLKLMNDSTVDRYLNRVQYKYNTLKFKKFSFKFLRFLQVMGGFAITTMTTYNNPYFKENSDKVNIVVWYVSISNNIFNMLIEKLNAYDLKTMEVTVDLLINEGELFKDNRKDYKYYQDNENEKKLFLKKCSEDIQSKDPYIYLSDNIYPRHNNIQIYNGREKRLERVWAFPVPTPENNNIENLENLEGTEVQEDSQNEIQNEIQGLNQPNSTIDV